MMQALDSRLQEVLALDMRRQYQVSHAPLVAQEAPFCHRRHHHHLYLHLHPTITSTTTTTTITHHHRHHHKPTRAIFRSASFRPS
jgi:hypothetical protein